jgi:hypothetical protein
MREVIESRAESTGGPARVAHGPPHTKNRFAPRAVSIHSYLPVYLFLQWVLGILCLPWDQVPPLGPGRYRMLQGEHQSELSWYFHIRLLFLLKKRSTVRCSDDFVPLIYHHFIIS